MTIPTITGSNVNHDKIGWWTRGSTSGHRGVIHAVRSNTAGRLVLACNWIPPDPATGTYGLFADLIRMRPFICVSCSRRVNGMKP